MMTSTIRKFGVGVASIALVAGVAAPAVAADPVGNRFAGADRYDTAIKVAEFDREFTSSPSVVYVARGDILVDAVTAGTLKNGPMLLVNDDAAVQDKVAATIKKLGPTKVVIIGGEKAISKDTVEKIVPATVVSERISGKDRFETAAQIAANGFDSPSTIYLANGMTLVDALTGGQLINGPILLTDGADKLPEATAKALNKFGSKPLRALGGTGAVSDATLKNAAVAQTILVDSFVADSEAAAKAKATAQMKIDGYVTAGPGVSYNEFIKAAGYNGTSDDDIKKQAALKVTWPRITANTATIPNTAQSKELFAYIDPADGKTKKGVYSDATAQLSYTDKYADGTAVLTYAGTQKTIDDYADTTTIFNNTNYPTLTGTIFTNTGADLSTAMQNSDTALSNSLSKVKLLFAGKYRADASLGDFLKSVGVATPSKPSTTNSTWQFTNSTDPTATAGNSAFEKAWKAAVAGKPAMLTAAQNANLAAKKELADAVSPNANGINTNVDRISGGDRYATAVAIAKSVFGEKLDGAKDPSRIYLANGDSFADAAVAGMLTDGPILLVKKDSVPAVTASYIDALDNVLDLQRSQIVALGGTGVIEEKNLTDEIERVAPANQASGNITFSTPKVEDNKVTVPVTTKDLPNGSTLKLMWQYKDEAANSSYKTWTDVSKVSGAVTFTPEAALKGTDGKDAELGVNVPGALPKNARVRLTVETVARNGETITKATTTEIKLNAANAAATAASVANSGSKLTTGDQTLKLKLTVPGAVSGAKIDVLSITYKQDGDQTWTAPTSLPTDKPVSDVTGSGIDIVGSGATGSTNGAIYTVKVKIHAPGYTDVVKEIDTDAAANA